MPRRTTSPLPAVQRVLRTLGDNLRLARLRRGFSAQLVAERAGISRTTLRAVEQVSAAVTFGAYANVLHSLGLHQDLLSMRMLVSPSGSLGGARPKASVQDERTGEWDCTLVKHWGFGNPIHTRIYAPK